MKKLIINKLNILLVVIAAFVYGCSFQKTTIRTENKNVPLKYQNSTDTLNIALIKWKEFFNDNLLIELIDTALKNNQELNIVLQEIAISNNEIQEKKGEYLPFLHLKTGGGIEKEGRFTRHGAVDEQLTIKDGENFPEPFSDVLLGLQANWELDVWKKLRNAKKSAVLNYLATVEGKNFMLTNLIAEISESYYELMALDNLLDIVNQNIEIQKDALNVVRQQKKAAKVTQLAVNRFEAQLLNTTNLQFDIKQRIIEAENRINFLTARYPSPIKRASTSFTDITLDSLNVGVPSQLLLNRPDIRQAEYKLAAAKLDVKVARANFYPSIGITANAGFQSFNPAFLLNPESIMYNFAGDLLAPLVNRNAIKAAYKSANSFQIQAVYEYEQSILNAYIDVVNQLNKLENYSQSFNTKKEEVVILKQSINIANSLFYAARADYAEVLFTQREALEAKIDLVEIKMQQMSAKVNLYRALGGGWN